MTVHHQSAADVASVLETDPRRGVGEAEARSRLDRDGPNSLPQGVTRGPIRRLLRQFGSPLIYVLIGSAVVTFFLEDYVDSGVIAGVVVINALIGFIQEGRAEKALEAVRGLLADRAVVIRGGVRRDIAASDLVVGDVISVESGTKVPADARLVDATALAVSEASLTGESLPVEKNPDPVPVDAPLAERTSMIFAGTLVTSGTATAIVTATGSGTELGKIGSLVEEVGTLRTPLSLRLDRFALQITLVILAIGALAFAGGYFVRDEPLVDLFLSVVALAVAAIPEGLPAVVTIVLALGTRSMAINGALVRRLPAVESLGSVSIIWTDKTGTLTQNQMTVSSVVTATRHLTVTGVGYGPEGEFRDDSGIVDPLTDPALAALLEAGVLCNRAEVNGDPGGEHIPVGDPMEAALITLGAKAGIRQSDAQDATPQVDHLPFESERRFMATVHDRPHLGDRVVWVKGAPERIVELAESEWDGSPLDSARWLTEANHLAASGQRVLALAGAKRDSSWVLPPGEIPSGFRLLGLVGIIDPPRSEAASAIAACQRAGIAVKMITGDHVVTAQAIGGQLGLRADRPLTGAEIDYLDDRQLTDRMSETDVVARANPEHKLRLVRLSQQAGFQVAMTGDGVNDAPALQAADIGVAMGKNGTDAARNASDLVLSDDRFETIERAVERGRVVFDNIKKTMMFVLPTDIGEASVVLVALIAGWVLPISASQILWVNLVTAVTLSLALVVERAEAGVMERPPRPATEQLITGQLLSRIVFVGVLMLTVTLVGFWWQMGAGASLEEARTSAVTMLVVAEMWYLFSTRRFTQSGLTVETFFGNRMALVTVGGLVGLQLAFTYLPVMNTLFGTSPIGIEVWGVAIVLGLGVFLLVEVEKWLWRKRGVTSF
jgi:magnesium-transporting ATPase (P-type)